MILGSGLLQSSGWTPAWLIRDEFTDTRAAGSVDGTAATPGPGTRTVTDTESKISVGGGVLTTAGGRAAPGVPDPSLTYGSLPSSVGLSLLFRWNTPPGTAENHLIYLHKTSEITFSPDATYYRVSNLALVRENSVASTIATISRLVENAYHHYAIVQRSTGSFFLSKASGESAYTLDWVGVAPTWGAATYISMYTHTGAHSIDWLRALRLPAPFDTDDGLATDTHSGSVAAGTTFAHEADCLVEYTLTTRPSADNADVLFRVQDASNYWVCRVNSSGDISLVEVVAGTPTTRGTAAGVVSSGHRVVIIADGTTIKMYSNNTLRITYASASNFATATAGEVDALGTGGVVSDVKTWPRTLSGTAASILDKASA